MSWWEMWTEVDQSWHPSYNKKAIDHDNNADEDDYCASSTTMILIIIIMAMQI